MNRMRFLDIIVKCFLPSIGITFLICWVILTLEGFMLFYGFSIVKGPVTPTYEVSVPVEKIRFILDSIAINITHKPVLSRGDEVEFYLPKTKASINLFIEHKDNGSEISITTCMLGPNKMFVEWIGDYISGNCVPFFKAYRIKKEFEWTVFKNNGICYDNRQRLFWTIFCRLVMYPVCFWWQTLLSIFLLLFIHFFRNCANI